MKAYQFKKNYHWILLYVAHCSLIHHSWCRKRLGTKWTSACVSSKNQPWYQGSWGQNGAHLGPTGPGGPHVGPMKLAIWEVITRDLPDTSYEMDLSQIRWYKSTWIGNSYLAHIKFIVLYKNIIHLLCIIWSCGHCSCHWMCNDYYKKYCKNERDVPHYLRNAIIDQIWLNLNVETVPLSNPIVTDGPTMLIASCRT